MTNPNAKFLVEMIEGPGAERGRRFESEHDTAYDSCESAAWKFENDDFQQQIWEPMVFKVTEEKTGQVSFFDVEPCESKDFHVYPKE